jgi:Tfp pilus assembly protein PilO
MTKIRQWSVLTAIAVLLVFVAGYLLLIKPPESKTSSLKSKAAAQEATNQTLQAQIASLQTEEKNLVVEQRELNKFSTQVPPTVSEPSLILQLQQAANAAGVNLISITPGTTAPVTATATSGSTSLTPSSAATSTSTLESLPLALGIYGTYANVAIFFNQLSKMQRSLLVSAWSLCPLAGGSSSASGATCSAPSLPAGYTAPPNAIAGTLTASVFFAPPAGSTEASAGSSLTPGTTTTAPAGTTATPAATTTPATGASTAPTN